MSIYLQKFSFVPSKKKCPHEKIQRAFFLGLETTTKAQLQ